MLVEQPVSIAKRKQILLNERNKLIAEAEKLRNLQLKNIQELFDFTVQEINDKYQV